MSVWLLPVALGIVMLGLGLSLTPADFKRVIAMPRAIMLGLFIQTVVLTSLCALIVIALALPAELGIGMMLLAAAPGGASANIFSHLAHGDVALNITLTAINGVLALVTLPVIVGLALVYFQQSSTSVAPPFIKLVEVSLLILLPVAAGMCVRAYATTWAIRAEPTIRALSVLVLVSLSVMALMTSETTLLAYSGELIGACVLFNLTSMAIGYFAPRMLGMAREQAIAISMEISIHNAALAIYVGTHVLGNSAYAVPAAIYAFVMAITAAIFTAALLWQSRQQQALRSATQVRTTEKDATALGAGK